MTPQGLRNDPRPASRLRKRTTHRGSDFLMVGQECRRPEELERAHMQYDMKKKEVHLCPCRTPVARARARAVATATQERSGAPESSLARREQPPGAPTAHLEEEGHAGLGVVVAVSRWGTPAAKHPGTIRNVRQVASQVGGRRMARTGSNPPFLVPEGHSKKASARGARGCANSHEVSGRRAKRCSFESRLVAHLMIDCRRRP